MTGYTPDNRTFIVLFSLLVLFGLQNSPADGKFLSTVNFFIVKPAKSQLGRNFPMYNKSCLPILDKKNWCYNEYCLFYNDS